MNLYSCPDCTIHNCNKCFRYISAKNNLESDNNNLYPYQCNNLFQLGNIVYYYLQGPLTVNKNIEYILKDFPEASWWKKKGLNNKIVKLVIRDYNTNEEFSCYGKLKIYNNILTILPTNKLNFFSIVINNKIYLNINKTLHFIYISCEEICFTTHKIMHDDSLFIDIDKNKIGVTNPLPNFPDQNLNENVYILKLINGQLYWIKEGE